MTNIDKPLTSQELELILLHMPESVRELLRERLTGISASLVSAQEALRQRDAQLWELRTRWSTSGLVDLRYAGECLGAVLAGTAEPPAKPDTSND